MKLSRRLALGLFCGWAFSSALFAGGWEIPANQTLALTLDARGVQIYECRAVAGDPAKYEWAFKAPEADLFDAQGRKVGRHYAGPTWELADGSKVERVDTFGGKAPAGQAEASKAGQEARVDYTATYKFYVAKP